MRNVVNSCQFFPYLIKFRRIFQRADGKSGGKIIISAFCSQSGRFFHTQAITFKAAFPALRYLLQTFRHLEKFLRIITSLYQFHRMNEFHGIYQTGDLMYPFPIFFFRKNIGIIIKNCNVKIFRQIFQHITAARRAAAVQEQTGNLILLFVSDLSVSPVLSGNFGHSIFFSPFLFSLFYPSRQPSASPHAMSLDIPHHYCYI